jgi:hypothetical protein
MGSSQHLRTHIARIGHHRCSTSRNARGPRSDIASVGRLNLPVSEVVAS